MIQEIRTAGAFRWPSLLPCTAFAVAIMFYASTAWAQTPLRRLPAPPIQYSPALPAPAGPTITYGVPSPHRPQVSARHQERWNGYGFGGVPTYQWGYFGARPRPYEVDHWGYYGHQLQWSFRRGL